MAEQKVENQQLQEPQAQEEQLQEQQLPDPGTIKPNRIFYIVPHSPMATTVEILDITEKVQAPYKAADFEGQVEKAITSKGGPWLTIKRNSLLFGKTFTASQGDQQVAEWKAGLASTSKNLITFPSDSKHCSHPITVQSENGWKFWDRFVQDSVTYIWQADSAFKMRKFTLYKTIGAQRTVVGNFELRRTMKYGGLLVLDATEVDEVVGVLTCAVMVRKRRLKDGEIGNVGAGAL